MIGARQGGCRRGAVHACISLIAARRRQIFASAMRQCPLCWVRGAYIYNALMRLWFLNFTRQIKIKFCFLTETIFARNIFLIAYYIFLENFVNISAWLVFIKVKNFTNHSAIFILRIIINHSYIRYIYILLKCHIQATWKQSCYGAGPRHPSMSLKLEKFRAIRIDSQLTACRFQLLLSACLTAPLAIVCKCQRPAFQCFNWKVLGGKASPIDNLGSWCTKVRLPVTYTRNS